MNGSTHMSAGIAAGAAVGAACRLAGMQAVGGPVTDAIITGIPDWNSAAVFATFAACGALGGLLPDMDLPTSMLGRAFRPVSVPINAVFGHRGFFHSPLVAVLVCTLLCLSSPVPPAFACAVGAGMVSHLFLDMLNPSGVPLLWPVRKRFRLAHLPSDSPAQAILGVLFLFAAGTFAVMGLG